jgi:hypothetical protein
MAATAAMITRLRRWVAEPTEDTYTDEILSDIIERYPVLDDDGYGPDDDDWTATYDLHAAAAEVWEEKAASLVGNYDFSADGSSFHRSQAYDQAMLQVRHHRARRRVNTITLQPEPRPEVNEDDLEAV